ncbi:MAG: hypothetical protein SPG13_00915 [Peptostreptococcus porci]|uniref:Uncharacterized protein n=1 Tax=Peptostreptococcus porci TaxID=2652282 RepID=A0A6N7XI56_9FIRM|nr:hypothetical protein [Peptostreptococcus porci]MDY5479000.1 hypothetical protein [Peptostreptococcus porci]MST63067.1 hypothetical protein [Peptostreptococcus porci]
MITIMDVKKAFNEKLKKVTGVGVGSHAIDENIEGPIFFTEINVISSGSINKVLHRNNLRLRALYYPAKKLDKVDMYKVQCELEKYFRLSFEVGSRVLNVQDLRFDIDEEEVSNEILGNTDWYGNGLIAYKDKIYMIGLFSTFGNGDYDYYTDNVAEYDINLNKWNASKKLKFRRGMGAFCVIENVVYYFSYSENKLCTYNLDTESNIFTGIVDNTDSSGGALIMIPYKNNIYMIRYNNSNMIIYKIDLSSNTIYEYSKFKTNIDEIQACYDGNYIYFSDGIKIYRFDIETKTYELFFDFSPIASRSDPYGRTSDRKYSINDLLLYKDNLMIISRKIITLNLTTKTYKISKSNISKTLYVPNTCSSCVYKKTVYVKSEAGDYGRKDNLFKKWFI